jgi:hypothetical protein
MVQAQAEDFANLVLDQDKPPTILLVFHFESCFML